MSKFEFKDARLKLERAARHQAELGHFVSNFYAENPPEKNAPKPLNLLGADEGPINISIKIKPLPTEASPILGDAIHNIRAALDVMAVELVRCTFDEAGKSGNTKNVYFPFSASEGEIDAAIKAKNFARAGSDAVALLKTWKPYIGGNELLRSIHDLDIQDKHHAVVPIVSVASAGVKVELIDGVPVLSASFPEQPPIVFPEDSILSGADVNAVLEGAIDLVRSVIASFENLVSERTT